MARNYHNGQQKFPVKFADCNAQMVADLRKRIKDDLKTDGNGLPRFKKYNQFTICLPPLYVYPDAFKCQYNIQVCDLDMKHDLKTAKIINWCSSVKYLYPVKTTADGNCLLHAISQAMWGIEDDGLFLREILYVKIASDCSNMKERWQHHQLQLTRNRPQEFVYHNTSLEMSTEWENIVKASQGLPRQSSAGLPYHPLEGIHLYAMANVLARPIIVLGKERVQSAFGESMQENSLYGIYLPLELDPQNTFRCPIIIGYNQNHFAPLVTHSNTPDGKGAGQNVLPLVMSDTSPLPVRFVLPEEESSIQDLLKRYMKTKNIPYSTQSSITTIPAVITDYLTIYDREDLVSEHRRLCEQIFAVTDPTATFVPGRISGNWTAQQQDLNDLQSQNNKRFESRRCVTEGCEMFGSSETAYMCSDCFRKYTIEFSRQEAEQKGYHVRSEPSAPPMSIKNETNSYIDISWMGDNCHNNCGNKCSVNTYPYCHECWPKYNQVQPQEEALASMSLAQGTQNVITESENRGGIEEHALFGVGRNDETVAGGTASSQTHSFAKRNEKEDLRLSIRPHTRRSEAENTEEKRRSLENTLLTSMPSMESSSETYPMHRSISKSLSSEGTPSPRQGHAMGFQQTQQNDLNQGRNSEAEREINNETERETVSSTIEQSPPETSELNKRICAKAGCRGLRLDNNYGYCLECWNACFGGSAEGGGTSTMESRVSLSTEEINEINPLVISSKQKVICTSPVCNNRVYPPHKLCSDCIKILNDAYNARSRSAEGHLRLTEERRTLSYSPPRPRCKKPGCTYTGNSKFEGFCSACYREDQIAQAIAAIRPSPPLSRYRATSSLCVEPGCDRYGDPNMFARCTEHFRKYAGLGYIPEPPPATQLHMTQQEVEMANVGERQPTGPTSLYYRPPGEFNIATHREVVHHNQPRQTGHREHAHNLPFKAAMSNVERQMKSSNLCKTRGCKNFGNVKNKGYCNSCSRYKQTHQQGLGHSGEFEEHTCC